MTLNMPTPESLEAEAVELVKLAERKERQSGYEGCTQRGRDALLGDAAIFREEAKAKRAKAACILKADIEAGLRTPSGTLVSTIESMHSQRQKHWEDYLSGKESDFS